MSHLVRLALLSVLVFVAMSAYLLIPAPGDFWEASAQKEVVCTGGTQRLSIFITEPESPGGPRQEPPGSPSYDDKGSRGGFPRQPGGIRPQPVNPVRPQPSDPAPEPALPRKRQPRTHRVQKGDTLSEIAARLLGSVRYVKDILKANPGLRDPDNLKVGQVLILPTVVSGEGDHAAGPPGEKRGQRDRQGEADAARPAERVRRVKVKKGDTLYAFAERYLGDGSKWPRLLALNQGRIRSDAKLVPGTTILVPLAEDVR